MRSLSESKKVKRNFSAFPVQEVVFRRRIQVPFAGLILRSLATLLVHSSLSPAQGKQLRGLLPLAIAIIGIASPAVITLNEAS